MSAEQVAREHYAARRSLSMLVAALARELWLRLTPPDLDNSWAGLLPRMLVGLSGAQVLAARAADPYTDRVVAGQGADPAAAGQVVPGALAGIASDGRPLGSLLLNPIFVVKAGIAGGVTIDQAMTAGYANLDMLVRTQLADAGRAADQVAIVARPAVTGYVRMLVGASCSRCVILAGRRYAVNAGFLRHPSCLPAGVTVSGPATLAATRRWYEGELVVVSTASGQRLPITGNHPVLTDRGWVPAHLLQEGDQVVRSTRGQGATALVVPDEDQVPARIEDVRRADGMVTFDHVPLAAEDFHGDGLGGEVDVVFADRLLRHGLQPALAQLGKQEEFARRVAQAALLAGLGPAQQQFLRHAGSAVCSVRAGRLSPTLVRTPAPGGDTLSCGHAADLHSFGVQSSAYDVAGNVESLPEAEFALSRHVGGGQLGGWQGEFAPRWDAPAGPLTMQSRAGYADRGQDLLLRLSGQVELDRVVEVSRVERSGHVYNLTSVEGWYSANGLIVSNCDCVHVPAVEDRADDARTDPRAYFDRLTAAEQDKAFTKAGAEAIRLGSEPAKIVNARRGMRTATAYGRQVLATTEAAGRRVRLMPETIMADAKDRDDAIRLLRLHKFLI